MIEHELLAEELPEAADGEDEIRRIARMDDVEPAAEADLPRKHELHEQRARVLDRVAEQAIRLLRQRVTMDVDAVDALEAFLEGRGLRTVDGDREARRVERARLLPHAPIERQRQVFHDDEHAAAG